MAFERTSDLKITGSGLDAFVQGMSATFARQLSARNAQDELKFNLAVLDNDMSLDDQLAYREKQLERVADVPAERDRVKAEIAGLKQRIEQKEFADQYTDQVIDAATGVSSVDGVISWLRGRLASVTEPELSSKIRSELLKQESAKFDLQQTALSNRTTYAEKDKTESVLTAQISSLTKARNEAIISGNDTLVSTYDLQLQSLDQARRTATIENTLKDFSVRTLSGYQTATQLLDSMNTQISNATADGPLTVGGVKYNSPQEFWTSKRDSYISDTGTDGFFNRLKDESKTILGTKQSQGLLSTSDISNVGKTFDALAGRPELQTYTPLINSSKQEVVQAGADAVAKKINLDYLGDLDVNKAFNGLDILKGLGVNVDETYSSILLNAAATKQTQVSGILSTVKEMLNPDSQSYIPGLTPEQAIAEATKTGAGSVASPTQLASKTETQIATEQAKGAAGGTYTADPRTTVDNKSQVPKAPPIAVQNQNLSSKYGIVGKTVYRKSDGKAFTSQQEFFQDSGINSFQGVTFDTAYKPPVVGASPALNKAAPAPAPSVQAPVNTQYKVAAGDTLSAISQRLLGDPRRYNEIAKANNITDPNKISVGQQLIIPKK